MKELSKHIILLKMPNGAVKNSDKVFAWMDEAMASGVQPLDDFYSAAHACIKNLVLLDNEDNRDAENISNIEMMVGALEEKNESVEKSFEQKLRQRLLTLDEFAKRTVAKTMADCERAYKNVLEKRSAKTRHYGPVSKPLIYLYAIKKLASCLMLNLNELKSWREMCDTLSFDKDFYTHYGVSIVCEIKRLYGKNSEALKKFFETINQLSFAFPNSYQDKCHEIDHALKIFVSESEIYPEEIPENNTVALKAVKGSEVSWKEIVSWFSSLQEMITYYKHCNILSCCDAIAEFLQAPNLDNNEMLLVIYAILRAYPNWDQAYPALSILKTAKVDENSDLSAWTSEHIRKAFRASVCEYLTLHREKGELLLPNVLRDLRNTTLKGFFWDLRRLDLRGADLAELVLQQGSKTVMFNGAKLGGAILPSMWQIGSSDLARRKEVFGIFSVAQFYDLLFCQLNPYVPIAEEDFTYYHYLHLIACQQYIDRFFMLATVEEINHAVGELSKASPPLGGGGRFSCLNKEFQARFYLYLAKRFFESLDDAFIEAGRDWFLKARDAFISDKDEKIQSFSDQAFKVLHCAILKNTHPKDLLMSLKAVNFSRLSPRFIAVMCSLPNAIPHVYFKAVLELQRIFNEAGYQAAAGYIFKINNEDLRRFCRESLLKRVENEADKLVSECREINDDTISRVGKLCQLNKAGGHYPWFSRKMINILNGLIYDRPIQEVDFSTWTPKKFNDLKNIIHSMTNAHVVGDIPDCELDFWTKVKPRFEAVIRVNEEINIQINHHKRNIMNLLSEIPNFIHANILESEQKTCRRSFKNRVLRVLAQNPKLIFEGENEKKLDFLFGKGTLWSTANPLSGDYKALKESARKTRELEMGWKVVESPAKRP